MTRVFFCLQHVRLETLRRNELNILEIETNKQRRVDKCALAAQKRAKIRWKSFFVAFFFLPRHFQTALYCQLAEFFFPLISTAKKTQIKYFRNFTRKAIKCSCMRMTHFSLSFSKLLNIRGRRGKERKSEARNISEIKYRSTCMCGTRVLGTLLTFFFSYTFFPLFIHNSRRDRLLCVLTMRFNFVASN